MLRKNVWATVLVLAVVILFPQAGRAGSLSSHIIGLFPKDLSEFAYADLKSARRLSWFPQIKDQMLPARFKQFETFLVSAGIDPNVQVEELAWGATLPTETQGDLIIGVALGQFQPATTEQFFKQQKLPTVSIQGYTLYAFGSGAGAGDIFFFFIDTNTAAFGHREVLEKLIAVRFGTEESLLRNEQLYPLVDEVNGRAMIWGVLDQGYTRMAIQQLIPEAGQFPESPKLLAKMKAMTLEFHADRGVDARFQTVCETPDDANLFAALLQAGLVYRRYQEAQSNPELAKVLEDARVAPRGDRMEVKLAMSEDVLKVLLRKNTFAVKL